jgi:hypothetical protein
VAIADEAGGDWPVKARDACKALVDAAEAAEEDQLTSIQLLADIRQVFDDKSKAFLSSTDLVAGLWAIEDSPWSDSGLTKHRLASQLRDYGIKPTRDATGSVRGYRLTDFKDAFDRYLRHKTSEDNEPPSNIFNRYESFNGQGSSDALGRQTDDSASNRNRSSAALTDVLPLSDGNCTPHGLGERNGYKGDSTGPTDERPAISVDARQLDKQPASSSPWGLCASCDRKLLINPDTHLCRRCQLLGKG